MTRFSKFLLLFCILMFPILTLDPQTQQQLLNSNLEGSWSVLPEEGNPQPESDSPFAERITDQGQSIIYFISQDEHISGVVIEFLMPRYYDQKMLRLIINFAQPFNQTSQRWQGLQNIKYEIYNQAKLIKSSSYQAFCVVDEEIVMIGSMNSSFSILTMYWKTTINPKTALIFTILAFVVLLIVRRKSRVDETHIRHQLVPIIIAATMVLVVAVTEIIIGFRSLFGEMSPEAFFTVSGCLNLAIFYQICRFYGARILQGKILIFFCWGLVVSYIWFLLYFRHNYICLLLNSMVFLPEIIYHALKGQKIQADPKFYFIVSFNQIYVLYFKACPLNIFRESPSNLLGYLIIALIFLQIGLCVGQIYFGSRFFVPSLFLPNKHNYYNQKIIKGLLKPGHECYICLQVLDQGKKQPKKLMITPCKHVFHSECLEGWMLVKMQCPVDRSKLSPL